MTISERDEAEARKEQRQANAYRLVGQFMFNWSLLEGQLNQAVEALLDEAKRNGRPIERTEEHRVADSIPSTIAEHARSAERTHEQRPVRNHARQLCAKSAERPKPPCSSASEFSRTQARRRSSNPARDRGVRAASISTAGDESVIALSGI